MERDFHSSVEELLHKDQRVALVAGIICLVLAFVQAYLCVKRSVVIGCAVLERIQTAFLSASKRFQAAYPLSFLPCA